MSSVGALLVNYDTYASSLRGVPYEGCIRTTLILAIYGVSFPSSSSLAFELNSYPYGAGMGERSA